MKNALIFLLSILSLGLTGCFDLIEQVSLNSNGSGTFTYIVNGSRSKANIGSLLKQDSVFGQKVPSTTEIDKRIEEAKAKLSSMNGISNVQVTKDYTNYVFKLTCDFVSVDALDKALSATAQQLSKNKKPVPTGNFAYKNKTFSRRVMASYTESAAMNAQIRDAFTQATYTAVYKFSGKVKQATNPNAKIGATGNSAMIKRTMLQVVENKQALHTDVILE